MAINPAGTEMFVTLQTSVAVVNLSTQRTVADIALSGAEGIAVNPNGSAAYATNGFHGGAAHSNTVSVISTSTNTVTAHLHRVHGAHQPDGQPGRHRVVRQLALAGGTASSPA